VAEALLSRRKLKPYFERQGISLYLGDARDLLPALDQVDVIITDPVWPNAPFGMFPGVEPWSLFAQAAKHFPRLARRVVVQLGCTSDPRFLSAIPRELPFVRACWMRYLWPSAKGTVLNSGDVAYVFGSHEAPLGMTLIPGEFSSKGKPAGRRWSEIDHGGHPCPRDLTHVEWLVDRLTRPNDVVLDPFAGWGTTLIASHRLGRRAVGIEVNECHCESAARRIEDELRQGRLL
jgi:hypothetical protein